MMEFCKKKRANSIESWLKNIVKLFLFSLREVLMSAGALASYACLLLNSHLISIGLSASTPAIARPEPARNQTGLAGGESRLP